MLTVDRTNTTSALAELRAIFAERLVTSEAVRAQHANTTTWIAPQAPDGVVFPQSTDEIIAIARICARLGVPMVPFGTGTSFEGHVNALQGGVSIDFREMNRVLAVHPEDFDCVVEPGITRVRLNEELRSAGLFFSVDPGADASIGGMASTRASGTTAVHYGTMRDNVLSMKVVLPNGDLMTTGRRARKSSAGYDLTHLFIGAEGTLGIITELTLRLHPLPESVSSGLCPFPSVEAACNAAIAAIQMGIPMARVEFADEAMIQASNKYSKLNLPETPTLFLEFNGSEAGVVEQSQRFGEIVRDFGGGEFVWSTKPEERSRLWHARHDAYWAMRSFRTGAKLIITDVCVPISRFAECVTATKADLEASRLVGPIVGHSGDGNFHVGIAVMMEDEAEVTRAKAFVDRLTERAIAMDGTCTGEHGIGTGKMRFLETELGGVAVEAMRTLKRALDPAGIMNPGKIV
jgi:D-lactate dehydrogenase (cytochrome)